MQCQARDFGLCNNNNLTFKSSAYVSGDFSGAGGQ